MSSKHRSYALFAGCLPQPRIALANAPLVERLRREFRGVTGVIRLLLDPDTTWRNGVPRFPGCWKTIPPCRLVWVGAVIPSPDACPTPHLELLTAPAASWTPLRIASLPMTELCFLGVGEALGGSVVGSDGAAKDRHDMLPRL